MKCILRSIEICFPECGNAQVKLVLLSWVDSIITLPFKKEVWESWVTLASFILIKYCHTVLNSYKKELSKDIALIPFLKEGFKKKMYIPNCK